MLLHARGAGASTAAANRARRPCPPGAGARRLVVLATASRVSASPAAPSSPAPPRPSSSPPPPLSSSPPLPAAALAALPEPPKGLPPGFPDSEPPSLLERALAPLGLGDMVAFMQRPLSFLGDRRAAHGDAFGSDNILFKRTVFLFDEADVRRALSAEHRLVEQRWPKAFAALLGPSFQGGKARHAFHRRAMGAAFTADAIAAYQPLMQRLIERRLEKARLGAEEAQRRGEGDGTFPAWTEHMIVAFDVAVTLLLGFGDLDERATRELHSLFRVFVQGFALTPPVDLPFTRHGKAMAARRRIGELLSRHLEPVMASVAAEDEEAQAAAQAANGGSGSGIKTAPTKTATTSTAMRAFLTARDDDGNRVTADDAREMIVFVAFAGHETTGTSISQCLRLLDQNRRCWRALVDEQRRVVARHGERLTPAAAADMPYADAVVRETLRLSPVVRFVWREALEDFDVAGGTLRVARGSQVVCSLSQPIDDIPLFAADREAFRPERWLEPVAAAGAGGAAGTQGEGEGEDGGPAPSSSSSSSLSSPWRLLPAPSGYLPFGAGGRVCLGLPLAVAEMRAFCAVLARGYEFEVRWPGGGEPWDGKATVAGFQAPGGMPVRLTPRPLSGVEE